MEPIRGTDDAASATRTHRQFRFALFVQRNVCRARTTVKHSFCSFLLLVHSLSPSLLFSSLTTRMSTSLCHGFLDNRPDDTGFRGAREVSIFRTINTRARGHVEDCTYNRNSSSGERSESDGVSRGGGLNRVSVSGALTRRNEARRNAVKGPIPITFPDQFCNFR